MPTHVPVSIVILGPEPYVIYGMRASDGPSLDEIIDVTLKRYLAETDTEDGFTWADVEVVEPKYWQAAGLYLPTIIRGDALVTKISDEQIAEPDERDVPTSRAAPPPRDK